MVSLQFQAFSALIGIARVPTKRNFGSLAQSMDSRKQAGRRCGTRRRCDTNRNTARLCQRSARIQSAPSQRITDSMSLVMTSEYSMPLAAHAFGYMEIDVKPGIVLISLTITEPSG